MKVYSIGREAGCDIVINDNSDVISRRHATLNVSPSGKMTIVDLSHNGTYVNGIRISQNVPVPVTRKDNVSFAHVARLDWNLVPNTGGKIIRWAAIAAIAIIVIVGGIFGYKALSSKSGETEGGGSAPAMVDSTLINQEKQKMEEHDQQVKDSLAKHVQDSLDKIHKPAKSAKPAPAKPKVNNKVNNNNTNKNVQKPEPKKEEPTTVRKRG